MVIFNWTYAQQLNSRMLFGAWKYNWYLPFFELHCFVSSELLKGMVKKLVSHNWWLITHMNYSIKQQ